MGELFPVGIEAQFASLYFDLAQALSTENFEALQQLVPVSHMMFGSDHDNFAISQSTEQVDALGLDSDVYAAICRDNALRLFGCLE